jgi:hypothetical protein
MKEEDLFEYAADILWPLFDANNDGKIDFNEFSIGTLTYQRILLIDKTFYSTKKHCSFSCYC